MKRLWMTGTVCLITTIAAFADDTSVRYDADRDRTLVVHENDARDWRGYHANELSFSFFGTGTVGENTIKNPSSRRIDRDGQLGAGAGISYFFHRYVGVEGYGFSESTGGRHWLDYLGANIIGRFPIAETGLAPYIFAGAARQIDPIAQWGLNAGGGLEWRFARHVGVFVDGRYVWADKTKDYGIGRLGIKFGF